MQKGKGEYLKKLLTIVLISIIIGGCSDDKDNAGADIDYKEEIEALQKENQVLKDTMSEYSSFLQEADRTSRRFMDLLAAENCVKSRVLDRVRSERQCNTPRRTREQLTLRSRIG